MSDAVFDHVMHLGDGQGGRAHRKGQNRSVRGIDFAVDGRHGQVVGQQISTRIDRRLHLLLGNVQGQRQREPERDDRGAT